MEVPNLDPSMNYDSKVETFWTKLRDTFMSILKKIFRVDYNNRSFLAKLTSIIDTIYSNQENIAKEDIKQTTSKQEAKVKGIPLAEPIEETTSNSEEDTRSIEEKLKDLDAYGDEDIKQESSIMMPNTNNDFDINYIDTLNDIDNIEDVKVDSNLSQYIINPNEAILDANNEPIC
jgi:hypothetical protein